MAPDFTVTKTDLGEVHLKGYVGHKIILNIFPSLDTDTCANSVRHFNDMASLLPDVLILCISNDLPFAQKRFCLSEHLANVLPVSTFRHRAFGTDYGVLIIDEPLAGLLSRAVVVIDEKGKVIYTEQVKELSNEPNYDAVLDLLKNKETLE
jgi:thiol peroxidase